MSFARNRRLFGEPLEGVGVLGCRPLGCGGPMVWLPCSLSGDSPSFQCPHSPSQLLPIFHQGIGSKCCGSRPSSERSDRSCSSFSRLLQPPVCYRMWSLQLRLNSASRLLRDSDSVSWDASCLEDLRWWSVESHLLVGLPLGLSHPSLSLFMDASGSGWGGLPRRRPHVRLMVS